MTTTAQDWILANKLSELKHLRETGQLTEEEYQRLTNRLSGDAK
jgi:hypothetical protein